MDLHSLRGPLVVVDGKGIVVRTVNDRFHQGLFVLWFWIPGCHVVSVSIVNDLNKKENTHLGLLSAMNNISVLKNEKLRPFSHGADSVPISRGAVWIDDASVSAQLMHSAHGQSPLCSMVSRG